MKVRDVMRRLNAEGWIVVRTRGDHRHFKHGAKPGIVTVAGHPNRDIPLDTLKSIFRQAGWEDKA